MGREGVGCRLEAGDDHTVAWRVTQRGCNGVVARKHWGEACQRRCSRWAAKQ